MDKGINYSKIGFIIIVGIYGIRLTLDPATHRFLDRVDLIAHEAGHLLFSYFGEFIMIMGGTILQIFIPAVIIVYFITRHEFYSSAVTLFWLGQNMFNISVYIKDARDMVLPLVSAGGGDIIHDWNYTLSKLGILNWNIIMGNFVYGLGILIITASIALGIYFSFEEKH